MIIFINGPFGVGKTTVAEMLVKAIPMPIFAKQIETDEITPQKIIDKIIKDISNK